MPTPRYLTLEDLHLAQSPQGLLNLFGRLGYSVEREVIPLNTNAIGFALADAAAIKQLFLLADEGGQMQVILFELEEATLTRTRSLAGNLLSRGGNYLMVATQDYRRVIFVNPRREAERVKICKLWWIPVIRPGMIWMCWKSWPFDTAQGRLQIPMRFLRRSARPSMSKKSPTAFTASMWRSFGAWRRPWARINGSAPVSDIRRIFRLLQCAREEPRLETDRPVFEEVERAASDILRDLQSLRAAQRIRPQMSGLNKKFYEALNQMSLLGKSRPNCATA